MAYFPTMADIQPFRAVRFNLTKASLSGVICPPYDAIPTEMLRILRRFPANAVHLELPEGTGERKYRGAFRIWQRWLKSGILQRDKESGFYICRQSFIWGGRKFQRLGLFAALGLDDHSHVLPHERTLSGPKKDRLRLLKALRVNTSPVFGIFSDEGGRIRQWLRRFCQRKPLTAGRDSSGIVYQTWKISEAGTVARLKNLMRPKKILLADGHHRYRVACLYARNRQDKGSRQVLIYLCPEGDPGLLIFPTHRIVSQPSQVLDRIHHLCRVRPCASLKQMERLLREETHPAAFGYFTPPPPYRPERPIFDRQGGGGVNGSLNLAKPIQVQRMPLLGVEWIRRHLLKGIPLERISYSWNSEEVLRAARDQKRLAIFLKGLKISQIRKKVESGRLLPQKSTFFYPKIATGLLFREL
ncbi:MAG: DUF1015 domain-containing protein [Elusimicrobia bacterium]|nr:DUF1015 domain-containing protein [Elusimicrobiota bacterium]